MGIHNFFYEVKANASPKRMFKALVTENYDVIPKVVPQVKSIELLEGDVGAAGRVQNAHFSEEAGFKYMKTKTDFLDTENYVGKFTILEGELLGDKLEKICYELKFEDSKDGGCVIKMTSEFHTKGDVEFNEEDVKAAGIDLNLIIYKNTGDYLAANPHVCA